MSIVAVLGKEDVRKLGPLCEKLPGESKAVRLSVAADEAIFYII